MMRDRTGYSTLNRTRMLTGSGQPLFSKVQSFNIELLSCCSPQSRFYCCRIAGKIASTAAQRPHVQRHHTHRSAVLRLTAVLKKKVLSEGEIFKYFMSSRLQGRRARAVTSPDGFRGLSYVVTLICVSLLGFC